MKEVKVWYKCPNCKQRLLKYDEMKGKSTKLYIKCKSRKKEVEINIE